MYAKRQFSFHGVHEFFGCKAKAYAIVKPGFARPDLKDAMDFAATAYDALDTAEFASHGVGYFILHLGEDAQWVLARLWVDGDIIAGVLGAERGRGFMRETSSLVECVWEHVIARHERDAWVRTMMITSPSKEAYLKEYLSDGLY